MADTYLYGQRSGADAYQKNASDPNNPQSQLFNALMQQTMQQQQAPGVGGIMTKALQTYMGMGGNPMNLFGGGLNDQVNALDTASGLL